MIICLGIWAITCLVTGISIFKSPGYKSGSSGLAPYH
jgi:hypothetical protein